MTQRRIYNKKKSMQVILRTVISKTRKKYKKIYISGFRLSESPTFAAPRRAPNLQRRIDLACNLSLTNSGNYRFNSLSPLLYFKTFEFLNFFFIKLQNCFLHTHIKQNTFYKENCSTVSLYCDDTVWTC